MLPEVSKKRRVDEYFFSGELSNTWEVLKANVKLKSQQDNLITRGSNHMCSWFPSLLRGFQIGHPNLKHPEPPHPASMTKKKSNHEHPFRRPGLFSPCKQSINLSLQNARLGAIANSGSTDATGDQLHHCLNPVRLHRPIRPI